MAIEVVCKQCGARLQVPDEAAGAQAKCPHCADVFDIDASTSNAGNPVAPIHAANVPNPNPNVYADPAETMSHPGSARTSDDTNPYASPRSVPPPANPFVNGPIELGRLDAGMSVQLAWQLFLKHAPLLLTTHGTFLIIVMILGGLSEAASGNGASGLSSGIDVVSTMIQWFLTIGTISITLGIARGRDVEYGELFAGAPKFLRFAGVNILFMLMLFCGFVLLVVPAVYLFVRFWPAMYFVVDRDMGVIESFKAASHFTEGNKMQALLLILLSAGIAILGIAALCVGFFAAYPVLTLMWTISYLMITRQPIHRSGRPA